MCQRTTLLIAYSTETNQSKLQLHAKHKKNYKQPKYDSFEQYR